MDRIFNAALLTPRNILVIGLISVAWHIALCPVFKSLSSKGDE